LGVRDLANRLGVSEEVIKEDLALLPRAPRPSAPGPMDTAPTSTDPVEQRNEYPHPRYAGLLTVSFNPATSVVQISPIDGVEAETLARLAGAMRYPPPPAVAGRAIGMATAEELTGADD